MVDIRKDSPTFGKYVAVELTEENKKQLYMPRNMAHGFVVLSEEAIFSYKVDNIYAPKHEATLAWDDPDIGIDWKLKKDELILSDKDKLGISLSDL